VAHTAALSFLFFVRNFFLGCEPLFVAIHQWHQRRMTCWPILESNNSKHLIIVTLIVIVKANIVFIAKAVIQAIISPSLPLAKDNLAPGLAAHLSITATNNGGL
jgi:hypothetical protein